MSVSKIETILRDIMIVFACLVIVAGGDTDWYRMFWLGIAAIWIIVMIIDINKEDDNGRNAQ